MSITVHRHPFGAGQVSIERTSRTFWFAIGVDAQNDSRNFPPVRIFGISIKQPKIRYQVAMVIAGQLAPVWRNIGDICIKRWFVR